LQLALFAQQHVPDREKETLNLAIQEYNNESYETALTLFSALLEIRIDKYGRDSTQVANALTSIGAIKSRLGLYDQAIPILQEAAGIYSSSVLEKDLLKLATVQQNLAICFNVKGDFEKAEQYYENAGRIYEKLNVSALNSYETYLLNMAGFYLDYKIIQKAEKLNDKAFQIQTDKTLDFKKWNNKGQIAYLKGDYPESIRLFKKSIEVGGQDIGADFNGKDIVYLNLGLAYLDMENFDLSLQNYQIAKALIEKGSIKQPITYSYCLKDMGINYLRKSERESTLENFLQVKKKNIETSLVFFQEAIIAVSPGFIAKPWTENPEPQNAIDKIRLLDALKNKAGALYQLAKLNETQENNDSYISLMKQSLHVYDISIKTIQLIRNGFQSPESRLFLSENEHPVYSEALVVAAYLYEKTGDKIYFEKGFEISERSRSADFQTMLRELQAKEFSGMPDSLVQKETELKGEIAAYENFIFNESSAPAPDQKKINLWKDKVFSLTQSYQQMIDVVEKQYPRYYQYKYADPIVSVQKVQQSLGRREAFIEYFIREGKKNKPGELFTFVIADHEYKIIRRPIDESFSKIVDSFLRFLQNGMVLSTRKADYIQYTRDASNLYKLLIEPIVPTYQNYKLVIVPDDKLSYLPFDAFLATPADTTRMDFRNLDYLLHHHAVSYTYSATLLYYYFQNTLKYSNKIAAFAPDYPLGKPGSKTDEEINGFLPLPGAKAEVAGLSELIPGDQFIGSKATKEKFLQNAENYDIIHLAMHTILNDTLPLYSKMVFSPGDSVGEDRTLNTFEIYNLKLRSDMVVLSGCNTGSGKLQKGEGVMSLARAFLYAGCPSIIMTLWNVEDASSSTMMIEFYRNIKNGYSKDEALRRAKVKYISLADPMKAHPYFWLGYVSIGKQTPLFKTKARYFVGLIIFVFLAIVLEKWYFKRKKRINRLK
jgi:CHAT domain-containing protein